LEDTYQDVVLDILSASSVEPTIKSKEHLKNILIKKCLGSSFTEINQQRNDTYLLSGYTGANMSRHERTIYPQEFIKLLTPLQQLLCKCLNQGMTYLEIDLQLNGSFAGSIGYMRSKYRSWITRKPYSLSDSDIIAISTPQRDHRSMELIERLLSGEPIGAIAEDLKMKPTTAWNLKYEILKILPHLKPLIPRHSNKGSSKVDKLSKRMVSL